MIEGLEHEFMIDREYIENLVCTDEIDRDILEIRKLTSWKITQRIRCIDKRLDRLIGQKAAEKHGIQWVSRSFMHKA